jgi:hypothetical protein
MRRETVIPAMARQESDTPPSHFTDRDRVARRPERGIDLDLFGRLKELIETGAPDDADSGGGRHEPQATFSPEEPEDPEERDELEELSGEPADEPDEETAAFSPEPEPDPFESGPPEPEPVAGPESLADALDSPAFSFAPVWEPLPERLSVR